MVLILLLGIKLSTWIACLIPLFMAALAGSAWLYTAIILPWLWNYLPDSCLITLYPAFSNLATNHDNLNPDHEIAGSNACLLVDNLYGLGL